MALALGATLANATVATAAGRRPVRAVIAQPSGETGFNTCHKLPAGKRVVRLNLKPDTDLTDLITWISSITCKQFIVPGTIPAGSKRITIYSPELITPAEAYGLFLAALESFGLTVYPSGKFMQVIETAKAKTSPIPIYGFDEAP